MSGVESPSRWEPLQALTTRMTGLAADWRRRPPAPSPVTTWVEATPFMQALSVFLGMVSATLIALLINLLLISPVQHFTSQQALFEQFRLTLAEGSVPVGPVDSEGALVEPGTPVAILTSNRLDVLNEVIVQGTAGAQTMQGIGHRRDSVMPCQPGTSVLMARSGGYGALGAGWATLEPGDVVTITTGQGRCGYRVIDQRRVGETAPPAPLEGEGRLVLTTGAGIPFMPNEVLRVDLSLESPAFESSAMAVPSGALPKSEAAMATDDSPAVLFGLILLLELFVAAAVAVTWMWRRWGKWQTWIVGVPVLGAISIITANSVNQWLLPNLL